MDSLEVMQEVEQQKERPFVGAKIYESMEINTAHDQGDVRIIRIEALPPADELTEIKDFAGVLAQGLADGNDHQIQAKDLKKVKAFIWKKANEFIGPFLVSTGSFTLTHKNHKWATFPAGIYQTAYPCELNLGQLRRTRD